jgi:hypothetical protein
MDEIELSDDAVLQVKIERRVQELREQRAGVAAQLWAYDATIGELQALIGPARIDGEEIVSEIDGGE